jgi:acyl carrier protein
MIAREELQAMLMDSLREYAEDMGVAPVTDDDARLMGRDSNLDSLGLVMVIAAFEAKINDRFGTQLVLADDRAMSMERSPFGTPRRLVDYAALLLSEQS